MILKKKGKKYEVTVTRRTPRIFDSLEKVAAAGYFGFEVVCPKCNRVYETGDPRESLFCDECNEKEIFA